MNRKLFGIILGLVFFISVLNFPSTTVKGTSTLYARPPGVGKPPKKPSASVDIRSVGADSLPDHIMLGADIEIIAEVTGDQITSVSFSIDNGPTNPMFQWGSSNRYFGTWSTSGVGDHTIKVWAENDQGNELAADTAVITVVDSYQGTLYYEIDWMVPVPQEILDYWTAYWDSRAIQLIYKIDDGPEVIPYDAVVTQDEFWILEAMYNDHEFESYGTTDDRGGNVFDSQEKWVLWGSWDENSNVGGYTWVSIEGKDLVCGNYIFIAAEMCHNFGGIGAQVVVMMHEAGHSIGVAVLRVRGPRISEVYDADYYSIMSHMRTENCGFTDHWYYSFEYWGTRNLESY